MLNEIKIKNNGKLIITDNDNEIRDILKIANNILKRILFNDNEPKEYTITIYYIDNDNSWKYNFKDTIVTTYPKVYGFEFIFSNIDKDGLEYRGNFKIDNFNDLIEWNLYKCVIKADNNYTEPIYINLNTEFSLDIHNDNDVSVNNGMLKFNDNNAKISVIKDLKNRFDKESDKDESRKDKS